MINVKEVISYIITFAALITATMTIKNRVPKFLKEKDLEDMKKEHMKFQKQIDDSVLERKQINETLSLLKESNLAIVRSQITSKCEIYLDLGYLPEYARYCLEELFSSYKNLGGNHGIEILVKKVFELSLKR